MATPPPPESRPEPEEAKGDLSVTALYTSHAWVWGALPNAELFALPEAKVVFRVTNFALLVAKLFLRGLRSLKHSLVHRHLMIDHLVREAGHPQVLELAAGLSRRGATFSADEAISYVEVDLPHVVEKKLELLGASEAGRAIVERPNWRIVAADAIELDVASLVDARPVTVVAEGLFMYLEPAVQAALWAKLARLTARAGGLLVFDLVPTVEQPKPGWFGRVLEKGMKRFTGGRSFERDERTRDELAAQVRAAGFGTVELIEPADVAEAWGLPFPRKKTQQLLFVCRP